MYRAVAWAAQHQQIELQAGSNLDQLLRNLDIQFHSSERLLVNGKEAGHLLRTPEISQLSSVASAIPQVRQSLRGIQAKLSLGGAVVMEGRDIGTIVLPNAELKIFLTASPEERARRRHAELLAQGIASQLRQVQQEIEERDRRDSSRAISPLVPADDAIVLVSDNLSLEEVVEKIINHHHQKATALRPPGFLVKEIEPR